MHFRSFKKFGGFTIVEVAIVLAIVGIIVAGIYVAFSSSMQAKKLTDMKRQTGDIINNVRDYMSGRSHNVPLSPPLPAPPASPLLIDGYSAATQDGFTYSMIKAGAFPSDLSCTLGTPAPAGSFCQNPYSGNYYVSLRDGTSAGFTNTYILSVEITGLPADACINLGMAMSGFPGFIGLAYSESPVKAKYAPPLTVKEVSDYCTVAGQSDLIGNMHLLLSL